MYFIKDILSKWRRKLEDLGKNLQQHQTRRGPLAVGVSKHRKETDRPRNTGTSVRTKGTKLGTAAVREQEADGHTEASVRRHASDSNKVRAGWRFRNPFTISVSSAWQGRPAAPPWWWPTWWPSPTTLGRIVCLQSRLCAPSLTPTLASGTSCKSTRTQDYQR